MNGDALGDVVGRDGRDRQGERLRSEQEGHHGATTEGVGPRCDEVREVISGSHHNEK